MAQKHLIAVNAENLKKFKHLHECIFPLTFSRQFYAESVNPKKPGIHKIAFYEDEGVGVLSASVDNGEQISSDLELYIFSLGCKILYRRKGIGSLLLSNCLEFARNQNCKKVKLHVQETNEDALNFYKQHGFYEFCQVPNYYKKLTHSDAFVMCKDL